MKIFEKIRDFNKKQEKKKTERRRDELLSTLYVSISLRIFFKNKESDKVKIFLEYLNKKYYSNKEPLIEYLEGVSFDKKDFSLENNSDGIVKKMLNNVMEHLEKEMNKDLDSPKEDKQLKKKIIEGNENIIKILATDKNVLIPEYEEYLKLIEEFSNNISKEKKKKPRMDISIYLSFNPPEDLTKEDIKLIKESGYNYDFIRTKKEKEELMKSLE